MSHLLMYMFIYAVQFIVLFYTCYLLKNRFFIPKDLPLYLIKTYYRLYIIPNWAAAVIAILMAILSLCYDEKGLSLNVLNDMICQSKSNIDLAFFWGIIAGILLILIELLPIPLLQSAFVGILTFLLFPALDFGVLRSSSGVAAVAGKIFSMTLFIVISQMFELKSMGVSIIDITKHFYNYQNKKPVLRDHKLEDENQYEYLDCNKKKTKNIPWRDYTRELNKQKHEKRNLMR